MKDATDRFFGGLPMIAPPPETLPNLLSRLGDETVKDAATNLLSSLPLLDPPKEQLTELLLSLYGEAAGLEGVDTIKVFIEGRGSGASTNQSEKYYRPGSGDTQALELPIEGCCPECGEDLSCIVRVQAAADWSQRYCTDARLARQVNRAITQLVLSRHQQTCVGDQHEPRTKRQKGSSLYVTKRPA